MRRFIEEGSRAQSAMFPEQLDDYISAEKLVRVIDVFVDGLELRGMGFNRVDPKVTDKYE